MESGVEDEDEDDLAAIESLLYAQVYHDCTQSHQILASDSSDQENLRNRVGSPVDGVVSIESFNREVNSKLPTFKSNCTPARLQNIVIVDSDASDNESNQTRKRKREGERLKVSTPNAEFSSRALRQKRIPRWSESDIDVYDESSYQSLSEEDDDVITINSSSSEFAGLSVPGLAQSSLLDEPESRSSSSYTHAQKQRHIDLSSMSIEEVIDNLPDWGWDILPEDSIRGPSDKLRYYKRQKTVECKICREFGHRPHQCPKRGELKLCYICCKGYHFAGKCPWKPCVLCGTFGKHSTLGCPISKNELWNTQCRNCGEFAHFEHNCPEKWRYYVTLSGKTPSLRDTPRKRRYCFNCGRCGHFGHLCKEPCMNPRLIPHTPFVPMRRCQSAFGRDNGPSPKKRKLHTTDRIRSMSPVPSCPTFNESLHGDDDVEILCIRPPRLRKQEESIAQEPEVEDNSVVVNDLRNHKKFQVTFPEFFDLAVKCSLVGNYLATKCIELGALQIPKHSSPITGRKLMLALLCLNPEQRHQLQIGAAALQPTEGESSMTKSPTRKELRRISQQSVKWGISQRTALALWNAQGGQDQEVPILPKARAKKGKKAVSEKTLRKRRLRAAENEKYLHGIHSKGPSLYTVNEEKLAKLRRKPANINWSREQKSLRGKQAKRQTKPAKASRRIKARNQ